MLRPTHIRVNYYDKEVFPRGSNCGIFRNR